MMAKSISDHLLQLSRAAAPSGYEAQVRDYIAQSIAGLALETSVDPLGNLIAVKRGTRNERLLLAAHMDEIGFMITHVDEHGFLRFATLGGHSPRTLTKCRVRSTTGVHGMIDAEEELDGKEAGLGHLYIDIGAASKDEAEQLAGPGTPFVFDGEPTLERGSIIGKALDDRAGCAVLLSVLEALAHPAVTVVAAFTVQEEVGLRGATTSGYGQRPDWALAIDVTATGDTPKSRPLNMRLGGGAAVKVSDRSLIAHVEIVDWLNRSAEQAGIAHQVEVLPYGGTDAGAIHLSRGGVKAGCVSLPLRHLHSPAELVRISDLEAARALILAAIADPPR